MLSNSWLLTRIFPSWSTPKKLALLSIEISSTKTSAKNPRQFGLQNYAPIPIAELIPQISNTARRELLSSHVLASYFKEFRATNTQNIFSKNNQNLYNDVVIGTTEIHTLLTNWGEPAAAMLLAKLENISVRTIQNRLRLAREKGLVAQPGSGKRFS